MASTTVSGVASGIDWEGIIKKMTEMASRPAQVQVNKRKNLSNKKTLFEEMKVAMQKMHSSISSLKLPSTYRAKEVKVERVDSNGSYKGVLTASVTSDAEVNVYSLEVRQLAKAQLQRSNSFSGSLSDAFTGPLQGLTSSRLWISSGGRKAQVDVLASDTLESLAKRINTTIKTMNPPMGVTASVVDGRLILKSDRTGLGETTSKEVIKRSDQSWDALSTLSIDPSTLSGGDVTVTGGGKTWTNGKDFDVVGNQIRWREYDDQTAKAGDTYHVTYAAAGGDVYSKRVTRASGDLLDRAALDFVPSSANLAAGTSKITIKDEDGASYEYGTAFTLAGKSIVWKGDNRPANGKKYTVTYEPAAGEKLTLQVKRGDTDEIKDSGNAITYSSIAGGTAVITQGGKTYREGEDFDLIAGTDGKANVRWRREAAWNAPKPGAGYTLTVSGLTGGDKTFSVTRSKTDLLSMKDHGFSKAEGTIAKVEYGNLSTAGTLGVTNTGSGSPKTFTFTWTPTSTPTHVTGLPDAGTELTVNYKRRANTFTLSDNGSGLLSALGLDLKDAEHFTEAQDAVMLLDGNKVTRSSNDIGADYGNELIKGMTLRLKGVGKVSMDVEQDAEKAVKAIESFVASYNDLMGWINTRSSEKELDKSAKATVNANDFRMRWGALYGNSLLRDCKSRLRTIVSQDYTFTFKERKSADALYGTMARNGLAGETTLRVKVGDRSADIPVKPEDTLETIAERINDTSKGGVAAALHYDDDGKAKDYVRASVDGNRLVVRAADKTEVSLSGQAAMKALKLDYTYRGAYQLGLKTTKDDYGKSGKLEFDSKAFMKAMTRNSEEVQQLMVSFAGEMDTYCKSMLRSSAGGTSGTLTREIGDLTKQISDIDKDLEKFQKRLAERQEALRRRYAGAENRIAKLSQQANTLNNIIGMMQQNNRGSGSQAS